MSVFVKKFEIKYVLEALFQRKIFSEANPLLDFVLGEENRGDDESCYLVSQKISNQIPGWIISLHLELVPSSSVSFEVDRLQKEIEKKCKQNSFNIDLRKIF